MFTCISFFSYFFNNYKYSFNNYKHEKYVYILESNVLKLFLIQFEFTIDSNKYFFLMCFLIYTIVHSNISSFKMF